MLAADGSASSPQRHGTDGLAAAHRRLRGPIAAPTLLGCFAADDAVPPGAHTGRELVVALDHVDRLAQPGRGGADAQLARLDAFLRGHPHAVVAPHAGTPGDFLGLPIVDVDDASAPAVLDHESGRRVRVERGDLVVDVAAERHANAAFLAERQVVAL